MALVVTITVQKDGRLEEIKHLIGVIRNKSPHSNSITVLEAPVGMNYAYPLPVVTIGNVENRSRLYGNDAVDKLRDLAQA